MGYRVCQLILCHNNILIIGEWQSLGIKQLGQAENSIVNNICKKKMKIKNVSWGVPIPPLGDINDFKL